MISIYRNNYVVALASLFFGFLFVLCFPYPFDRQFEVKVSIAATGKANPNGKSAEVWVNSPPAAAFRQSEGSSLSTLKWEEKNERLVSYRHQPATFSGVLRFSRDDTLRFAQHPYSGEVIVKIGDDEPKRIDLYSPSSGEYSIQLRPYAKQAVPLTKILAGFLFWVAVASAVIFIACKVYIRFFPIDTVPLRVPPPRRSSVFAVLLYATPALLVFVLVHAVVWPGQLSPDSIDMFEQIVRDGQVSDAHSAVLIYFLKAVYNVFPHVAALIFVQYALFSIALGGVLYEMRMRSVATPAVLLMSLLIALYPGVFLIATTFWKDVPYTALLLTLAWWGLAAVRGGWKMTASRWCQLAVLFALIATVRHNGISVVMIFGLASLVFLFRVAKNVGRGIFCAAVAIFFSVLFIKPIVLERAGISPIGKNYRTMHALHLAGAFISEDLRPNEAVAIEPFLKIMQKQEWVENYRCLTSVPLFWHPKALSYPLAEHVSELNRSAVQLALSSPFTLISHQLCVTSLLWRITPRADDYVAISPLGIPAMPEAVQLGLVERSALPELRSRLIFFVEKYVNNSIFFGRPALLVFFSLMLCVAYWFKNRDISVIALAAIIAGNMSGLAVLMSAQDYRYQFPAIVIAVLLVFWCSFVPSGQIRSITRRNNGTKS